MKSFTILTSVVLSVFLASSCSKSESDFKKASDKAVTNKIHFSLHPLAYPSTHAICEDIKFNSIANLNILNSGEIVTIENLVLNFSYDGLPVVKNNEYLIRTVKNKRFVDTVSVYVNDQGQGTGTKYDSQENEGDNLVYCKEQELGRESLEHVALNIVSTLDKSIFILGTIGLATDVAPISIYSHPVLETTTNVYAEDDKDTVLFTQTQTMTDNAFYYNNGLYFIPHSQDYKDYLGDAHVDFWEIPFVASHEYGHHLFRSFFPYNQEGAALSITDASKHLCFKGREMMELVDLSEKAGEQRAVTNIEVLGSFNEGFADMFAVYSLDKASSSLIGVVGFETERDIESLYLLNGRPKIFSNEEADAFFSTISMNGRDALATYQDTHTIGAIFASTFNLLMNEGQLSHPQRVKVLITWLRKLNELYSTDISLAPKNYMQKVVNEFLNVLKLEQGATELSLRQQEILKITVPFYFQ